MEARTELGVGRTGLEPATFCTSSRCPNRAEEWALFRQWVKKKYARSFAPTIHCYAFKFHGLLDGNLAELEAFSKTKRGAILRALVALSKYSGVYVQFKQRMKDYGMKWEGYDNFESFMRILQNRNPGTLEWVKKCLSSFDETYKTFVLFAVISGMRRSEVINSFNLIVALGKQGKLSEYYNDDLQTLEHFRYEKLFLRGRKNVYFSFIPKEFVVKTSQYSKVSITTLKRRRLEHGLPGKFREVRDYFATFMLQHKLLQEEVDVLQGRIGRSMFMKHYFSPEIKDLRDRTQAAVQQMLSQVNS
jgi:hypothetical protein